MRRLDARARRRFYLALGFAFLLMLPGGILGFAWRHDLVGIGLGLVVCVCLPGALAMVGLGLYTVIRDADPTSDRTSDDEMPPM